MSSGVKNSRTGHKNYLDWSDSLFSTVYLWVKEGHHRKADADASILRYPQDHRLNALAVCMRSLVMEREITPNWFIEQGYQSAKHPDKAEEKRKALVLEHISESELLKVLSDVARADYLWPKENEQPKEVIDPNRLGMEHELLPKMWIYWKILIKNIHMFTLLVITMLLVCDLIPSQVKHTVFKLLARLEITFLTRGELQVVVG
ncbi:hypothetical protein J4731_00835 [Providencia rettgeri]|nr:hypothetical protein [Providencia rettgeri]